MSELDPNLQKINKFITLKNTDRQIYTPHYLDCLKSIIDLMKEKDDLFKRICKGVELAGSYVDNLKVSACDEYDTIVKLKLPLYYKDIEITPAPNKPAYIQINISKCTSQGLDKLFDKDGYLLQNKIQSWFESALTLTLNTLQTQGLYYILKTTMSKYLITYKKCGPAHTFCMKFDKSDISVSLDIVPVIEFDDEHHWMSTKPIPKSTSGKATWFAVAKPDKTLNGNNRTFLTSYQRLEIPYIKEKNKLKNLIRLFKKLRDNKNVANLKSYYIKTVFLHKVQEIQAKNSNKENLNFWNQSLGALFIIMFEELLKYLKNGKLPFFWDKRHNMFKVFTSAQLQTMHDQLLAIKKKIDSELEKKNPDYIIGVFLSEKEIAEYNRQPQIEEYNEQPLIETSSKNWRCVVS